MKRSAAIQRILMVVWCSHFGAMLGMTAYEPYDPLPFYSTANPHEFLYTKGKDEIRGFTPELDDERANFTVTFFGQQATEARDIKKEHVLLGDMRGTWNMLALTYRPCDTCPTKTELTPLLKQAASIPFCNSEETITPDPDNNPLGQAFFGNENALTLTQVLLNIGPDFGKVSVPLEYRKFGARFEASLMVIEDIGVRLQTGVASIQQVLTTSGTKSGFTDLSSNNKPTEVPTACSPTLCCVQENLQNVHSFLTSTERIKRIAEEIGLDVDNFRKTAIEDLRASIFWRHAVAVNADSDEWPRFLLMPFIQIVGVLGTGPKKDPRKMFSVSDGNNGHDSLGFSAGFSLDFEETLEIAAEGGGTFFSQEQIKHFRMPNHARQSGIFPCELDVCLRPGHNWHMILSLNARRFIDKLSAHVQFAMISHNRDRISGLSVVDSAGDRVFFPEIVEEQSRWNLRMFNVALNYEISPNIALGVLYQGPLSRRTAPRTKTLLASLVANF